MKYDVKITSMMMRLYPSVKRGETESNRSSIIFTSLYERNNVSINHYILRNSRNLYYKFLLIFL